MIEEKARDVYDAGGVSRIGIGDIGGIITMLIGLIANCRKNPTAATRVLNRMGPVQRSRVNQIIKDRLGRANGRLASNIESVAKKTTVNETAAMMQELSVEMAAMAEELS